MAINKNCLDVNRKSPDNLIQGKVSGKKGDVVFRWINGRIVALKAEYADNFPTEIKEKNALFFEALHKDSDLLVGYLNGTPYARDFSIVWSTQCLAKYNMRQQIINDKIGIIWYSSKTAFQTALDLIDVVKQGDDVAIEFAQNAKDAFFNGTVLEFLGLDDERDAVLEAKGVIEYQAGVSKYVIKNMSEKVKINFMAYFMNDKGGKKPMAIQRINFGKG